MAQRQTRSFQRSGLVFDPGRVGILNFCVVLGRMVERSLVSVSHRSGLNTTSLLVVKTYVMLIASRPSDGEVKFGSPVGALR